MRRNCRKTCRHAFCAFLSVCVSWWGCGVLPLWPDRGLQSGSKRANAKILENYPQMVVFFDKTPEKVALKPKLFLLYLPFLCALLVLF